MILELDGVHAFYGEAHILHGVSLAVAEGERVALIGRNGVGKTTTVNAVLGLARVRAGAVRFHGAAQPLPLRPYRAARAGIAVVMQGRRILPNLTVRENLLLGAAVRRPGPWTLASVCAMFPILAERAATPGTALSGGQQQMLAIGRALMANPDLLILDEPSEGLAPVVVDELGEALDRLATREGTALLLIEQHLGLIRRAARQFHAMAKGRIVASGPVAGLDEAVLHEHLGV